jgi:hypothetical protein
MQRLPVVVAAGLWLAVWAIAPASGGMKIDSGMPNRISMNLSVAKQSQGATFGEKVNAGLQKAGNAAAGGAALTIVVACQGDACVIEFPGGDAVRGDLQAMTLGPVMPETASGSMAPGISGGVVPGAGIVSAAVSSVTTRSNLPGGTAASAGYAATGRAHADKSDQARPLPSRAAAPDRIDVTQPLAEGEYLLTLVVEPPAGGSNDSPKKRVRIVQAFEVETGRLRVKHDTVKNSIANIR